MKPLLPLTLSLAVLAPFSLAAPVSTPKKPAAKPKTSAKPKPKPHPTPRPTARPTPVPTPVSVPVETGPKTWAVLVGVSHYASSQITGLHFPAKDASGLRDALVNPTLGGIAAQQVLLLTDETATREKIMASVDAPDGFLRHNVRPGDKVIVFLAGHGVAKGAGVSAKSYFLPTDVRGLTISALDDSAVPLRALSDSLATLPASQFVIFVDACREDPTPGRGLKGEPLSDVMSRGITVVPRDENAQSATFFACSVGQRAFEDEKYGHGVFTNWIIKGIGEGAVPQKPDGAIDMGHLSDYVKKNVGEWAAATSASGDFEVSQTPELSAVRLSQPMVLIKVKRSFPDTPFAPSAPRLSVAVSPENAQVSIDGARAGVGSVEKDLSREGDHTITASAPGYAPVSRSVKAFGGYDNQITLQMEPAGSGSSSTTLPTNDAGNDFYRRALDAQDRDQWEVAEQGFVAAIRANPRFTAAYEALLELHHLQNRNLDAIGDGLRLLAVSPGDPHALSLLSRAYSTYAQHDPSEDAATAPLPVVAKYKAPKNPDDAAKQALKAATEAMKMSMLTSKIASPEAFLAQGYALSALDIKGKNKNDAKAAFASAALYEPTNAANQLGMGYGIRYYAVQEKKEDKRQEDIGRAILALQEATKLRPNFYEAHRELAFCYIALDDTKNALRECRLARSNRGGASDINEIAGIEVAMSSLHAEVAQNSTGDKKTANEDASKGYLSEAKTTAPNGNLQKALGILEVANIKTSVISRLPRDVQQLIGGTLLQNKKDNLKSKLNGAINGAIRGL